MLDTYDETVRPILSKNYQDKIILIISCFDNCTAPNKDEAKREIIKLFKNEGINKIIFSSLNTSSEEISNQIF